jgi:hypothetical protein
MDHGNTDDIEAIALRSAVLRTFSATHRPLAAEMLDPDHLSEYGQRDYGSCLHRVLTQYDWREVQLANFRVDDDPPPFSTEIEQAEWARSVFELLSRKGISYYAPAVMLMILSDEETTIPLLIWLFERLDPDCDGKEKIEETFGHWSRDQVDTTIRFLDWALNEFPSSIWDEQFQAALSYWNARRE